MQMETVPGGMTVNFACLKADAAVQIPQDNPAQALLLAKQVFVQVYDGARKLYGDLSPVLVPPRYLPSLMLCFFL